MAEVAAVRVCLSRPAVSKANDLPWNLDNLSARLQSRERERDLHLFQVSLRSFSLFRFLSLLLQPLPHLYASIRLVSNSAATNCTEGVPTLYLSFADAARYEWNQKSGTFHLRPALSLFLSSSANGAALERVKTSGCDRRRSVCRGVGGYLRCLIRIFFLFSAGFYYCEYNFEIVLFKSVSSV